MLDFHNLRIYGKVRASQDVLEDVMFLRRFMSAQQIQCLLDGIGGEERGYFLSTIQSLAQQIRSMPQTHQTDGQGDQAVAYLHYFKGGMDWYITERDMEPVQLQAFGIADLGYGAELGYIDLVAITRAGAEMDFNWEAKKLAEIKGVS